MLIRCLIFNEQLFKTETNQTLYDSEKPKNVYTITMMRVMVYENSKNRVS